jgi:hypothetical protein
MSDLINGRSKTMDETIIQLDAELDHALAEHRRLAEEIALLADQTESTNEDSA